MAEAEPSAAGRRRFSSETPVVESPQVESDGPGVLRKGVLIPAASMIILGVLASALSLGGGGVDSATQTQRDREVFQLQSQIDELRDEADSLPSQKDAERTLQLAATVADRVAGLQNEYRILAATTGGTLTTDSVYDTRASLSAFFVRDVTDDQLNPWYLLGSDTDRSVGTGLATMFRSGFSWNAEPVTQVERDGSVLVRWVATEEYPPEGQSPRVLAWASATFDAGTQSFSDLDVQMTTVGESRGVKAELR